MRRRERIGPVPRALDGKSSAGSRERTKAARHYAAQRKLAHGGAAIESFEFKAYADPSVKEALHRIFDGKCAYCEAHYASIQPMDIDHYRPKNAVARGPGAPLHPGYWWLASDWTNLLPSCIDCNRQRGHDILFIDDSRHTAQAGKASRFPLDDDAKRVCSPRGKNKLLNESPLLLNPCDKDFDPEKHLEFLPSGVVRGLTRRGEASIEIYGLNRTELVRARMLILHFVEHRLYVLSALSRLLDPASGLGARERDMVFDLLEHEMDALVAMTKSDAPFSTMTKQVIQRAMLERFGPGSPPASPAARP